MRGRHPTRGVLSPGVFLPGASERDMLALTERVIVTALRDWEDCAAHGMSVKFNVNVPVSALIKLPIATIVDEGRPKAKNWPGLVLEVTEDEIIHDLKTANEVAGQLQTSHCTLSPGSSPASAPKVDPDADYLVIPGPSVARSPESIPPGTGRIRRPC